MFLVFRIDAVMGDGMSPWCLSFSSRGVWLWIFDAQPEFEKSTDP